MFELWVEEGEDGEMRQRAVRLDSVPATISHANATGPMLGAEEVVSGAPDGFLGGFPLDGFVPVGGIDAPPMGGAGPSTRRDDSSPPPPDFTVMQQQQQQGGAGKRAAADGGLPPAKGFINNPEANNESTSASSAAAAEKSGFASWSVRNGRVVAPDMKNSLSPFPFDVDGISMDELMSYEVRRCKLELVFYPSNLKGARFQKVKLKN